MRPCATRPKLGLDYHPVTPYLRRVPKIQGELIGVAEASEITGLDKRTLHRKVERGELQAVSKLPGLRGAYIFARSEIERLAKERAS